jgi:hypothetical protein
MNKFILTGLIYCMGILLVIIPFAIMSPDLHRDRFLNFDAILLVFVTYSISVTTISILLWQLLMPMLKRPFLNFSAWCILPLVSISIILEIHFNLISGNIYGLSSIRKSALILFLISAFWSVTSYTITHYIAKRKKVQQ